MNIYDIARTAEEPPQMQVPELSLWAAVLILCLRDIQAADDINSDSAIDWIRDPENIFFDWIAEACGAEPEILRMKIMKQIKRKIHDTD